MIAPWTIILSYPDCTDTMYAQICLQMLFIKTKILKSLYLTRNKGFNNFRGKLKINH